MILKALDPTQNVSLQITLGATGDNLTVEYVTPNGNDPNVYGNWLYLWQAEESIPWGNEPLQHQAISGSTRQGSLIFKELNMGSKGYIVGYSVGGETTSWVKNGNVCATAYLPAGVIDDPTKIELFSTKITPVVSSDSINVGYQVTPGVQPKTNGAWMALWRSKTNPYLNPNLDHAVPISTDDDNSSESFSGITLVAGATYTLAFMMSGWNDDPKKRTQTAIAAVSTFKID